jgi:hypothetical protein
MKVRIVGLGCMAQGEKCILSDLEATGYIEINHEMEPCRLSILGPGSIGEFVEVPLEFQDKLKTLLEQK